MPIREATTAEIQFYLLDRFFPGVTRWTYSQLRTPGHVDVIGYLGPYRIEIHERPSKARRRLIVQHGTAERVGAWSERVLSGHGGTDDVQAWLATDVWPQVTAKIGAEVRVVLAGLQGSSEVVPSAPVEPTDLSENARAVLMAFGSPAVGLTLADVEWQSSLLTTQTRKGMRALVDAGLVVKAPTTPGASAFDPGRYQLTEAGHATLRALTPKT